ncbi:MAG: tetratricopeptide repeat protein [Methylovulum sp.]|nr:MAG: tetratricopeptide repeat protein [Methylovulum sp.]
MPSTLASIRNLQQQGRLEAAITACQQALMQDDDLAMLALLGTLHCQNGNFDAGRECLQKLQHAPQAFDAETLTDMAGIHILLKEPAPAQQYLDMALAINPDYSLAQSRRGLVLMQTGRYTKAMADLSEGLKHCPESLRPSLHINLARCAMLLADAEIAINHVEQAQKLGGHNKEQWLLVAVDTYIALDRWPDAESAIQQALEAGTDEIQCIKLLALVLAAQDKHDEAEHQLRKALAKHPEDTGLLMQLAALAGVRGHYGEAVHCLRAAIKLEPENPSYWAQLAQQGKRHFDEKHARAAAEKAMALTAGKTGVERAEALVAMASVSCDVDEQQAETYYREALTLVPDYLPACLGIGHLLLQWGRIDEAIAQFETVTARHPIAGYGALINAKRFPDDPEILARIEKMAYIPSLQGPVSSGLLFDLAAAWEHRKDYDKAFHFADEANVASRKYLPYNAERHHKDCIAVRRTFDHAFFAGRKDYGDRSTLPVFVLGMPRSGTTLVEQILGGHPDIFVAGEIGIMSGVIQKLNAWERHVGSGRQYPECINDLSAEQSRRFATLVLDELQTYSADARYIVDKLPHNFEHIGLIRLLFPDAAIIHVLREPRDVAISNYFTDYQAKFGGMGFAYDLADIGGQLRDYQSLMAHWHEVLAKPVLTIRYEDVVADTEAAARKILAYLELEWTAAVLNYQNLERAVKTASIWQVRQPIYKTSTEKWRRYQAFLKPLEAVLNAPAAEPDDVSPQKQPLPAGLFFKGMEYLYANQGRQAAAVFEQVLNDNPGHAAAMHMLGVAMFQQNQAEPALKLIKAAIARHPGHAGWYQNLGLVFDALGMPKEAQNAYEKARKLKTLHNEHDEFWR